MIRTLILAAICSLSLGLSAQDTPFAQFIVNADLTKEQSKMVETKLGELPSVMQVRIGRDGGNVLVSYKPGTAVDEATIVAAMQAAVGSGIQCFRSGVVGRDRIYTLKREDCGETRVGGNVQD